MILTPFLAIFPLRQNQLREKFKDSYDLISEILKKAKDKGGNWFVGPDKKLTVKFYVQNGGGFSRKNTIVKSYKESLGFTEYLFKFDPSNPDQFDRAIVNILFYLFTVRDSVAMVYAGNKNILNLDIFGLYTDKEFIYSTYSRKLEPTFIWGREHPEGLYDHLTLEDYLNFATEFRKIFSVSDISMFTAFNNMNFNAKTPRNGRLMLWYIWQSHIKVLFQRYLKCKNIRLVQLTDFDLNEILPLSLVINL